MAKTLDKSKKRKSAKSTKNINNNKKKQKKINQPESSTTTTTTPYSSSTSSSSSESSSDSDSDHREFDPEELRELLQPYSKEQLVDLVCSASPRIGSSIYSAVLEAADRDVTHRKIFVYGLPWETTRDALFAVFEGYGEIEECTVVIDKVTGKAKGFGFVTFKSRKGAKEALKEPKKRILNRTATCQLAAMGPSAGSGKGQDHQTGGPVKISLGQSQQQQVFNGVGGGMGATPFMIGNQYHPVYGGGMMGMNPGLAAAAAGGGGGGGYMYPMLASALGQMGSGIAGDPGLSAALGPYFGGQSLLPTSAYSDPDTIGKRGKDSDAGGGSFNGYSNY